MWLIAINDLIALETWKLKINNNNNKKKKSFMLFYFNHILMLLKLWMLLDYSLNKNEKRTLLDTSTFWKRPCLLTHK